MTLFEDLAAQFEALNVAVDDQVLVKCGEICLSYAIDPEDFVDQWLAYSASKRHALAPTLDALERLERYELKRGPAVAAPSMGSTPRSTRPDVQSTPVGTPVRQNLVKEMAAESPTPDLNDSQLIPSGNFGSRPDAGAAVVQFGDDARAPKDRAAGRALDIKIVNSDIGKCVGYMYEKFQMRRNGLDTMTRLIIADILDHHKLELSRERFTQFSGEVVVCGRIVCESAGKLDHSSVMLEGPVDYYKGQRVKLSLNRVEKTRLFPGQAVVVSGVSNKDWFTAGQIYTGAPCPSAGNPVLDETVRILAAAGPFTVQENLLYEPLEVLLAQVADFKPNILLLMGPFLDSRHPHFENFTEFYETFFESMIQGIMEQLQDAKVQVVLVPSHRDVHNHVVFPTFPYKLKKKYENLYCAPNPFVLDVEGLLIGGSTADILFHLGKSEFSQGAYDDRIGHLVGHIFAQRNFYPLHPAGPDIKVDYQLLEQFGMFDTAPHVMILPSNFRSFVKVVGGCVVVNPERLAKGNTGGTFAKIEVRAAPKDGSISERVSCLIQKV